MDFFKYHGNGNDFIILDNRMNLFIPEGSMIAALCDRHFGIGADGLMLLEKKDGFDFSLRYYNSDGFESTMCGNGGRCMAAFAYSLGIFVKKTRFSAIDGPHEAEILAMDDRGFMVRLKMRDTSPGLQFPDGYFIDTGSPHFVKFVPSVDHVDVTVEGRVLRNDRRFAPGGCNVNFVESSSAGLTVRTYERGVENETLSCGTGVTASALIKASLDKNNSGSYPVNTRGGQFTVRFMQSGRQFTEVFLEGPAVFVFKGEISI
ncbi:MAG: diaminopimelate epimerase [Bacteroidetes bacterium]|nr:diaminopimelate epimerase [Bacteroidota bacterium]